MDLRFPCDYGGYRLTGLLGTGGTAEVYRAEVRSDGDDGTRQEVAIRKIARAVDREGEAILLEEARLWIALRHPNVVTVLDLGQHEADWFLVLELVDGPSVDQVLRTTGPLPIREALCITQRMALALHAAHNLVVFGEKKVVVHRDVKPANILLGSDGTARLTDFGIARATDRLGRTAAGIVKGSLHFLAPEQVLKDPLDARTDVFGLGCTLHTMLTGKPLLALPKDTLLRALAHGEIPPPPVFLPEPVRALLSAMLAPRPSGRPSTMLEVADRVRALLAPDAPEAIDLEIAARVRRFNAALRDDAGDRPTGEGAARAAAAPGDAPTGESPAARRK